MRTFVVKVPAGAKALRIDLDERIGHIGYLGEPGESVVHSDDADETAISDWAARRCW